MSEGWQVIGRAQIDERPPVAASLTICADGYWSAEVATFTLAGQVDLMFFADAGGHFCGPAFVERSKATTDHGPLQMGTLLTGNGPLLVVNPADALPELPSAEMVEGEVVDA